MHNYSMAAVGQDNIKQIKTDKRSSEGKRMLKQIPDNERKQTMMLALGSLLVVIAGIATGWQLSGGLSASGTPQAANVTPGQGGDVEEAGVADVSDFETVEDGILREGGFEGEGTHHLEMEGVPEEKFPYLTSAVIDLQSFVGEEVTIWGNTIAGQKAGWLVEVGKIKVKE